MINQLMKYRFPAIVVLNIAVAVVALYDTIVIEPGSGFSSRGTDLLVVLTIAELLILFLVKKGSTKILIGLNIVKIVLMLIFNWKQPAGWAFTRNGWIELCLILLLLILHCSLLIYVRSFIKGYKKK